MLAEKMKTLIKGSLSGAAIAVLILAALCVLPAITLFCINYLAAAGGSDFHIAHGILNYLVLVALLIIVGSLK